MNEFEKTNQSAYEQQENQLSAQSAAFLQMLTKRGLLADSEIDNDKIRQAQKEKKTANVSQYRNAAASLSEHCMGIGMLSIRC